MGIGTSRTLERVAAALGQLDQVPLRFLPSDDVPHGGLLCALPALLAMGLLRHSDSHFKLPKGFYPVPSFTCTGAKRSPSSGRSIRHLGLLSRSARRISARSERSCGLPAKVLAWIRSGLER